MRQGPRKALKKRGPRHLGMCQIVVSNQSPVVPRALWIILWQTHNGFGQVIGKEALSYYYHHFFPDRFESLSLKTCMGQSMLEVM